MPSFRVKIYFQVPETYDIDFLLQDVSSMNESISSLGAYTISNAQVVLRNEDNYFSRKFIKELPNNKRVEIYLWTGYEEILSLSSIVNDNNWLLTPTTLTLNVNA